MSRDILDDNEGNYNQRFYIIAYHGGDITKLCVAELSESCRHEKSDYKLASRNEFTDRGMAVKYCKELCEKHGLIFIPDDDEDVFLD